jgi:hypothetical protein
MAVAGHAPEMEIREAEPEAGRDCLGGAVPVAVQLDPLPGLVVTE